MEIISARSIYVMKILQLPKKYQDKYNYFSFLNN